MRIENRVLGMVAPSDDINSIMRKEWGRPTATFVVAADFRLFAGYYDYGHHYASTYAIFDPRWNNVRYNTIVQYQTIPQRNLKGFSINSFFIRSILQRARTIPYYQMYIAKQQHS